MGVEDNYIGVHAALLGKHPDLSMSHMHLQKDKTWHENYIDSIW